jgi:hypothetical protein
MMVNLMVSENATDVEKFNQMRYHRDGLLMSSDWTQVADAPVDREAWAEYRQALRDFPATWTPSDNADFPEAPQ